MIELSEVDKLLVVWQNSLQIESSKSHSLMPNQPLQHAFPFIQFTHTTSDLPLKVMYREGRMVPGTLNGEESMEIPAWLR